MFIFVLFVSTNMKYNNMKNVQTEHGDIQEEFTIKAMIYG